MTRSEVRTVLLDAVRELRPEFAGLRLTGDEHLGAELGLDSVARVELLVVLEEEFGIEDEVDPRIFMTPATVNALVDQLVVAEGVCP
ncbi:phosphopantetheine-binding protein [Streptomyces sp. NPDC006530]|uniref:phosphopantetheine-binding protein n=1 Tax=Streptomyces sp. NPDC006530 TaxID=3364750 RepID=UPI0036CF64A1